MFYLNDLCSLCLAHNKKFTSRCSINSNIEDVVQRIIPEFVQQTSEFQRNICEDCLVSLTALFKFRRKCLVNIFIFDEYVRKLQEYGLYKYLSIKLTDIKLNRKKETNQEIILDEDICLLEDDVRTNFLEIRSKEKNSYKKKVNKEQNENDQKSDVVSDIKKEISEEISDDNISSLEDDLRTYFFEINDINQEHSYIRESNDEQEENDKRNHVVIDIKKETSEKILEQNICFYANDLRSNSWVIDDIRQEHSYSREPYEEQDANDGKIDDFVHIKKEISEEIILDEDTCFLEDDFRNNFLEINDNIKQENSHNRESYEEQDNFPKSFDSPSAFYESGTRKSNNPTNQEVDYEESIICTERGKECSNRSRKINSPNRKQCHTIITRNKSQKVRSSKKSYSCSTCQKTFNSSSRLKLHEVVHTDKRPFSCNLCRKRFKQFGYIKIHKQRAHTNKKPFECNICRKTFVTAFELQMHNFSHSEKRSFECYVCQKSFKRATYLKRHEIIHTYIKRFKCKFCEERFLRKKSLIKHELIHLEKRQFQCILCDQIFQRPEILKLHINVMHCNDRLYECVICKKRFECAENLRMHKSLHSKDRPFKCDLCEKTYITNGALARHKKYHVTRSHLCKICHKSFCRSTDLKRHIRNVHTEHKLCNEEKK